MSNKKRRSKTSQNDTQPKKTFKKQMKTKVTHKRKQKQKQKTKQDLETAGRGVAAESWGGCNYTTTTTPVVSEFVFVLLQICLICGMLLWFLFVFGKFY